MSKTIIRRGSPFAPSDTESFILKGMRGSYPLKRNEVKFYAGDAGHCPRRAVKLLITDREGEVTPSSTMYMRVGTAIHEVITDALHNSGVLIFKELRLPPSEDPDIRGLIDALILSGPGVVGLEIKSCGNLPAKPKDDHLAQATLYSAISGFAMQIVYVSRKVAGYDGKLMLKSFDLDLTSEDLIIALSKVCLANYCYQEKLLPPIPLTFTREQSCVFCPFVDECWEGREEGFPTAKGEKLEALIDKADARAIQLYEERDHRRNGILKHIQRYTQPETRRKLDEIDWSS